ncbi:hypothetical protein [Bacillus sp. ISL-37]|uniref:hypothetical protein n=1 Tax=Bacillus sp. ISL-37 TaxID=2819123 RepID=UPI001BE85A3E|nr:hypothetical protein [Bacillus sp. ISL-37]MBT2684894.1 hypothetical protein [Bacillus sp. ISL-37]
MKKISSLLLATVLGLSFSFPMQSFAAENVGTFAAYDDPGGQSCLNTYSISHTNLVKALNANDLYLGLTSFAFLPSAIANFIIANSGHVSTLRTIAYEGRGVWVCVKANPNYNGYNSATLIYLSRL